jgi:hypothetical protein
MQVAILETHKNHIQREINDKFIISPRGEHIDKVQAVIAYPHVQAPAPEDAKQQKNKLAHISFWLLNMARVLHHILLNVTATAGRVEWLGSGHVTDWRWRLSDT